MGRWVAVTGMKLKPYCCIACGSTPVDEDGPRQAYFCEAVDVNWGDSLYLCESCVRVLGELAGMLSLDDSKDLKRNLESSKQREDELKEELATLQGRVDRMLDGVRAKKEVQKARPKPRRKVSA